MGAVTLEAVVCSSGRGNGSGSREREIGVTQLVLGTGVEEEDGV